ncbi:hypothetical protein ABZV91_24355 [Nocardia sp. NPDC004568]|uniref:hypothetical protein n=1 Tax=Nocardia sp. NPDC004568 TaxID=3154551 RepID=UPI0033B3A7CC
MNELGGRDFTEYKWGENVGGDLTMAQLAKDREALRQDPNARGTWVLVQGAADPATRRELDALAQDFPGRFHIEEITQQQAVKALRLGRELERTRDQLELVDSSKLRSQQRARERYEKAQEKERTRESARRAVEQQQRARREREAVELARQKQREALERLKGSARRNQEAIARGETPPMTAREAADILAVSRPTPGVMSPFREPPRPTRSSRDGPTRERGLERDR